MNDSRERYYAYLDEWTKLEGFGRPLKHFDVWQAAERQALERAAQVCEKTRAVSAVSYELGTACAREIRALMEQVK